MDQEVFQIKSEDEKVKSMAESLEPQKTLIHWNLIILKIMNKKLIQFKNYTILVKKIYSCLITLQMGSQVA